MSKEVEASGRDQDCLVCAIISHGADGGKIKTVDGIINFQDFCQFFTSENCPVLAGKPKIMIKSVSLVYNYQLCCF